MLAHQQRTILLLVILLLLSIPSVAQDPSAEQLIAASNSASDLTRLGSYQLRALIVVRSGRQQATGNLTVSRDDDNMRQEMEFTDYRETDLTRGDSDYLSRKPRIPVDFSARLRKFDQLWQTTLASGVQPGAPTHTKFNGTQALCFKVRPEKNTEISNCFDENTHLLVGRELKDVSGIQQAQFLDYQEIDGARFPSTIRFVEPGSPVIEAQKISIMKMPFDETVFAPLPGAREFRTCLNGTPPRAVHTVYPEYPALARMAHIQGEVRLSATIAEDGKPRDLQIISGHPVLAQAALNAVKQWTYTPEMCPSGPVSVETMIKVSFHM